MPGSIHVSVINFSGLPSSLPSSSILIKASMGKSDHQVWSKGDFSLPLASLRDNMIITLYDADGNEVSRTGVRIISIVEKGSLDESLSLKEGGIVHLKLRFVLNDEERNKIQRMRESAMKRKRDELLSISPRYSKCANTASGTVPLPSCDNHEVADSRASVSRNEVLKIGDQAIQAPKGNKAHSKEIIPYEANEGDGSKGTQLLYKKKQNRSDDKIKIREENRSTLVDEKEKDKDQIDVSYTTVMKEDSSGDKIETSIEQSTRLGDKNEMDQNYISNPSVTKDDSLDKKFEKNEEKYGELVEKNLEEIPRINSPTIPKISKDGLSYSSAYLATPEMNNVEEPLEKTPNSVRKMNSTDVSEDASPLVSVSQGVDVCGENLDKKIEKIKDSEEYQSRLEVKNEAKLYPTNFPQRSKNSEEASSNLEKDLTLFEVKKQGAVRIEKREPLQKTSSSVRKMISAFESSQLKETKSVIKPPPTKTEKVGLEAPKDLVSKDNTKPTKVISDIGMPESEIPSSNSMEDSIGNTLENETTTINSLEHESYSGETSSAWIFQENKTCVCITTDIKQIKDLVGTYHIEERLFLSENVEQDIRKSGVYTDMNESGKKESSNESRPGAETSSGPFGQAIKIALMVAFGSLILFTRQRNPR